MSDLDTTGQIPMDKLTEFSNRHPDYGSASDIWKAINQADPDQQRHIHTHWLLERTLSDDKDKRILWEDIAAGSNSKAHDVLKRFMAVRPLLPHNQRNLSQYGNLADVTAVIRPLEHVKTPSELKAEERERVDRDTVVLHEHDGYKILVPMTEEASCYWGRRTEWCTAATKSENTFSSCHKDGPLVICILPDGHKVQFHENSKPMDENNAPLIDVTDPVLVQLCVSFGRLGSISKALRDTEMCLEAVKQEGYPVQFAPDPLSDKEVCREMLKQEGYPVQFAPDPISDTQMSIEAMKQEGYPVQFAPDPLSDKEVCREMLKQEGYPVQFAPDEFKHGVMEIVREDRNKDIPEWTKTSLLEDMKQNLQKSCSFSPMSPKM